MTNTLHLFAEQAISHYLTWVNAWNEASGLDMNTHRATRADCDLYDDPPLILNDWVAGGHRTMTIYVSPFHDEGGPTILTAFFSNYSDPADWHLDAIDQLFDTTHQYIWNEGSFTNMPEADQADGVGQ